MSCHFFFITAASICLGFYCSQIGKPRKGAQALLCRTSAGCGCSRMQRFCVCPARLCSPLKLWGIMSKETQPRPICLINDPRSYAVTPWHWCGNTFCAWSVILCHTCNKCCWLQIDQSEILRCEKEAHDLFIKVRLRATPLRSFSISWCYTVPKKHFGKWKRIKNCTRVCMCHRDQKHFLCSESRYGKRKQLRKTIMQNRT